MAEKTSHTHPAPQPSEGVLLETDEHRSTHGAEAVGALAAPAGLDVLPASEVAGDPRAILSAYFDRCMANPHFGRMSDDPEKMAEYRDVFTDFLTTAFDPDLIAQKPWPNQDYYPAASEFAGMLASIYHNAGVYYPDVEVSEIFLVVANEVVNDELFQQDIKTANGGAVELDRILRSCVTRKMSVDTETALALVRGEDGRWIALDEADIGELNELNPLEVIRQDNDDKGGWNKYRFRQPGYARSRDDAHPYKTVNGWYTAAWSEEPSYWAGELRNMLATAAGEIDDQLQEVDAHVVTITDGGILKGTSTAGTDTDTSCIVVCKSPKDFTDGGEVAAMAFDTSFAKLPFVTKDKDMRPGFFDQSGGILYFQQSDGGYVASTFGEIHKGKYVFRVKVNEKGIGVTTSAGFIPYRKPSEVTSETYAAVDLESGDVSWLSEQELTELASARDEAKRLAREKSASDELEVW